MNDIWKILCLVLRQLFLDWPVALLDRFTFRKAVIFVIVLMITVALVRMGSPDAYLFMSDTTIFEIAVAVLLATARGHARVLLQTAVRLARGMIHAGWKNAGRLRNRLGSRRRRSPSHGIEKSDGEDGPGAWPIPVFA